MVVVWVMKGEDEGKDLRSVFKGLDRRCGSNLDLRPRGD